jgi:glycosyltransferase involved in cell wall biosynthesis
LNNPKPLVSIVIPTFNRANLLLRSIQSVIDQSYSNIEILVVDDCSSDNTKDVVESFHDDRIRYFRHEKNLGAVAARNTGIAKARGEYIAFQDSDDFWLPSKLERQMRVFSSSPLSLGVVFTSYWLIDNGRKTFCPRASLAKQSNGKIHEALLRENFVNGPTSVVRKACFEKAGVFENLPRFQEWGLWLRISKYYEFKHINQPLVYAYRQSDSISKNTTATIIARKNLLAKYYDELKKTPKLLSQHFFEVGYPLLVNGQTIEARSYFKRAIRTYPFKPKLILSFIFSYINPKFFVQLSTVYLESVR